MRYDDLEAAVIFHMESIDTALDCLNRVVRAGKSEEAMAKKAEYPYYPPTGQNLPSDEKDHEFQNDAARQELTRSIFREMAREMAEKTILTLINNQYVADRTLPVATVMADNTTIIDGLLGAADDNPSEFFVHGTHSASVVFTIDEIQGFEYVDGQFTIHLK